MTCSASLEFGFWLQFNRGRCLIGQLGSRVLVLGMRDFQNVFTEKNEFLSRQLKKVLGGWLFLCSFLNRNWCFFVCTIALYMTFSSVFGVFSSIGGFEK